MKGNVLLNPTEAVTERLTPAIRRDFWIGGITRFTTIDFPGRLAAVLYTQGCPWKCRYCYNSELRPLPNETVSKIDPDELFAFLEARRGILDGIVFSGGEPLLHPQLKVWMEMIKNMGYEIGLHTSGMFPDRLAKALPFCDWVGMDVKASFEKYEKTTQVSNSGIGPEKSVQMVVDSGIEYEVRTTVHPKLLSEHAILKLANKLAEKGVEHYVLQRFQAKNCQDEELCRDSRNISFSSSLLTTLTMLFKTFRVR